MSRDLQNELRLDQLGGSLFHFARDPSGAAWVSMLDMAREPRLVVGQIIDSFAYLQSYMVQVERGGTLLPCCATSNSSFAPTGVRALQTYAPGTFVLVMLHPQRYDGIILGAMPHFAVDARLAQSDFIFQGSHVGLGVDTIASVFTNWELGGLLGDYSAGRPVDSLTGGEWGAIGDTGGRIFLDSYMVQAAISEGCGIFGFRWDEMLRMIGRNLQIRALGWDVESLADSGEISWTQGFAVNTWEAQGMLKREAAFREGSPEDVQKGIKCRLDPKVPYQIPFCRTQQFQGYLGQGGKTQILVPPKSGDVYTAQPPSGQLPNGVGEQQWSLAGQYSLQAAHGAMFVKRPPFPVPVKGRRPEDGKGDTAENYKFAGALGSGAEHKVKAFPKQEGSAPKAAWTAAAALDYISYICNWENQHPFHYHKLDHSVQDNADAETAEVKKVEFEKLKSGPLEPPRAVKVKVDDRYGEVDYIPNLAYFGLLRDGSFAMVDGYGAAITTGGGDTRIATPGNLILEAGKSVIIFAGHDVILRAKNSIDGTATEKDVRLKAAKNMQMLSQDGGILLESRATSSVFEFEDKVGEDVISSGVMLRATGSEVVTLANDVYVRAVASGESSKFKGGGQICLQAGESSLSLGSGKIIHEASEGHAFMVQTEGKVDNFMYMGESLGVTSAIRCGASMTIVDTLSVGGQVVTTGSFSGRTEKVGKLEGLALKTQQQLIDSAKKLNPWQLEGVGPEMITRRKDRWTEDKKPGNKKVLDNAEFSLRVTSQYKTDGFQLMESAWQQMDRLQGGSSPKWKEVPVKAGSQDTYPFPGKEAYTGSKGLLQLELTMFDAATGKMKKRGDAYESPELKAPTPTTLNDYRVIFGT